ncbi:MAG: ABC transporter permease [Chloroflexi bacterium]|nr:ABC transporter permease [Chloroflexota bacterium]
MSIARRNLLQDKIRLALSVLGIALAVMLILVLSGFLDGVYRQAASYLNNTPGSVVVVQDGVSNFYATTSLLPSGTLEATRKAEGVAGIIPVTSQIVIFEMHGRKQAAQVVGYDPALGGGPWSLAEGQGIQGDGELVVDRVMAEAHGIKIGDRLTLLGREFTVVGSSKETAMWAASVLFVRKSALESLLKAPGATSMLLVNPSGGITPEALRDRLRSDLPGTNVLLKSEVIANDKQLFARIYNGPLLLMVAIAFLVGALVVGLVIYTATVERQREYGALKAIGAANRVLYKVVTAQALVASVTGSVLGVALAFAVGQLIMALRPQFLVAIEPGVVAWALVAGLVMALLGALFPARTVARLAPADVFRR